ncbi:MAG: tetratricopeptide repeat protein [Deltaproteobacteria bacterium]|nr:tetratricopeptide repeat protein [Deltaproteobacteria bacterium]
MSPWARPWVFAVVVGILQAVVLWPAVNHEFVLDDAVYITENSAVTHGAPLASYFTNRATVASDVELQWQSYRPLRTLAFRAVVVTFGAHAWAFRLINWALWIVSLVFLFRWLQRLAVGPRVALAIGALFALAPVHVEALVYSSALGDMLSLALQLAAIDVIVVGWLAPSPHTVWLTRTILACLLSSSSLLVKESAVVTPALLCAFAVELWKTPQLSKLRVAIDVGVQAFAVVGFLALRTFVLSAVGHAPTTLHSVTVALARLPWLMANYLRVCIAPLGHVPSYVVATPSVGLIVVSWVAAVALLVVIVWKAAGPLRFGMLWFGLGLGPVLGLVPLAADMADRYALLSSFGLACAATALVHAMARTRAGRWTWVVGLALGLLYVAGSAIEQAAWASDLTLWSKAIVVEPNAPQAYRNLGLIRIKQGRGEEAAKLLRQGLELEPSAWRVHYYLAMALESVGKIDEAHAEVVMELRHNPNFGRAHALRGALALLRGNTREAREALRQAQQHEPHNPSTLILAVELANVEGDHTTEETVSNQLYARAPADPRFAYLKARALLAANPTEALRLCDGCLQVAPQHPFCSAVRGRALLKLGRTDEARDLLQAAVEQLPTHTREAAAVRDALRTIEPR